MQARVRKMFLGGNTGYGFFSFYEQVVSGENVKTYILKGGPGTGKSSFMRQIAAQMLAYGHTVEEFYCSSDSSSLDGLQIPSIGVALIDGTAPHMIDPRHPGAIESVVDLAAYWDEAALAPQRELVRAAVSRSGFLFRRAYGYLSVARQFNDEQEAYIRELGALDTVGLTRLAAATIEELLPDAMPCVQPARERHLFASAITPQGLMNHLPSVLSGVNKRVLVRGTAGTGRTTLVNQVLQVARQKGYHVEVYHCALDPKRIDHVLIPQLSLAVCNASEPHTVVAAGGDKLIDTADYVDSSKLDAFASELKSLQTAYQDALAAAIALIKQAKENHAFLESLYVPHMDFERVGERRQQVLQQILEIADASKKRVKSKD